MMYFLSELWRHNAKEKEEEPTSDCESEEKQLSLKE